MKKQFFRVKQLADQRFSRAGKTEVLSDDLQEADRKVEYIRTACGNTGKKLALMCSGQDSSREKRLKKNPEYALGLTMQDSGNCEDDCLLSTILSECSKVEMNLANEALDYEVQVEQLVVSRLQQMLENDVPNILKHKRNLAKLTLDMDSARTRYQTAVKHSSANTGTSRVDAIKDELEDAELKVEQCRDMLASEMFQLISREADFAQTIVQYAKLQRAYHESALKFLEETIPELESSINDSPSKPVYGYSLEEHLRVTGRKVAFPIELCVCALLELGMEEEGLFRVAGGASKLRRMKMSFDACCLTLQTALEYRDPHVIAGALKSYLRELPEPLMTHALYDDWITAARVQSSNEARLQALKLVVDKLPQANYDNLRYLIKFLSAISRNQEVNKMTPQNIAIVIAPNLIWSPVDESNTMGMNMSSANTHSFIVDNLVHHADWFFPGEVEFYQTFSRETSLINGMTSSTGSVSGLQPHEYVSGGSPTERSNHKRGSSGEGQLITLGEPGVIKRTQSNSSLSDHSSPPQGSPKPAARRKNKPAPTPPGNKEPPLMSFSSPDKPEKPPRPAVGPMASTLPRPSKKQSIDHTDAFVNDKQQKQGSEISEHQQTTTTASSSKQHRRGNSSGTDKITPESTKVHVETGKIQAEFTKVSLETGKALPETAKPHPEVVKIVTESEKVPSELAKPNSEAKPITLPENQENAKSEHHHMQKPPVPPTGPSIGTTIPVSGRVAESGGGTNTIERKPIQRPVAAPRTTLNICTNKEMNKETSESTGGDSELEGVTLRRQSDGGERPNKPAVPERPATLLRPHSSFRGSRHSADSTDNSGSEKDSERPMLERTHMYSVDKQQVSIIQVGGEKEKTEQGRPLSMSLPDQGQAFEKPERPPKPENTNPGTERRQQQSSHSRTMSEGNIFDFDTDKSALKSPPGNRNNLPGSPKHLNRPPRPQPPPPPPPNKAKQDPVWESTDL